MSDTNYLDMSDEDMMKETSPEEKKEEVVEDQIPEEVVPPTEEEADDDQEGSEEESDDSEEEVVEEPSEEAEKPAVEEASVNYENEYKRILAPFKANGKDVKVETVDDAITLMQMGANYNKKMAALKPNLKYLKLLENNGLLTEEKINFLIDLDKKSPSAINKFIKDSGIDPMEIDAEKAGDYKPSVRVVDDREIALDTVLDEIQGTPTYTRTLGIVSKEWDGQSKQKIAEHPQLLRIINDHVDRGIYDVISGEVEREKMLGRLTGLSDLEAYGYVGDAIQARGGFNHLGSSQGKTESAQPRVVTPKPKPVESAGLKDKRRAASPSKSGVVSSGVDPDFNPLAMSDEEFSKMSEQKYR